MEWNDERYHKKNIAVECDLIIAQINSTSAIILLSGQETVISN